MHDSIGDLSLPFKEGNSNVVNLYNAVGFVPYCYAVSTQLTSTGRVSINLIVSIVVFLKIRCSNGHKIIAWPSFSAPRIKEHKSLYRQINICVMFCNYMSNEIFMEADNSRKQNYEPG